MRFSQKCLRKMREFKEQGKTCIFVSHDVQSVNVFCDTAMWIKDGEMFMYGEAKRVTTGFQNYMLYDKLPDEQEADVLSHGECNGAIEAAAGAEFGTTGAYNEKVEWIELDEVSSVGDGRAVIKRMAFLVADTMEVVSNIRGNEEVLLLLDIEIRTSMEKPQIGFVIYNQKGLAALHSNNDICGSSLDSLSLGNRFHAAFRLKLPSLANGNYIFSIGVQSGLDMAQKIDDVYEFVVARNDIKATQCGYSIIENETFELSAANR